MQNSTLQYSAVQYSAVQYSALQYSAVQGSPNSLHGSEYVSWGTEGCITQTVLYSISVLHEVVYYTVLYSSLRYCTVL